MAKRRQSKRQRAASLRNLRKARAHRSGGARRSRPVRRRRARRNPPTIRVARLRRYTRRVHGRRRKYVAHLASRRNGASFLGGWLTVPSMNEVVAVGIGALALPTITRTVTNLIPVPFLQGDSYGNIAAEFVVGSLAAGAAKKFGQPRLSDALLFLATARAVGRTAFQITKGTAHPIGFAEDGSDQTGSTLGAYTDRSPELGAYTDKDPALGLSGAGAAIGGNAIVY